MAAGEWKNSFGFVFFLILVRVGGVHAIVHVAGWISQPPWLLKVALGWETDPVSQWYVYPRDMCIPVRISLVICVSLQYGCQWNVYPLPPTPPNKCRFYFCCFCEFCESSSKGLQMIQDYEQHNRQKSNDSRQNNRKAVSGEFTSSWAAMLM